MAFCKQKVALLLLCLSVLYNICIGGRSFVEFEGGKTEDKEGRYDENAGYFCSWSRKYHGTRARINVWGIQNVSPSSESAVFIAVMNENGPGHMMLAGFHVYPRLYSGNTDLRLFTAWTDRTTGHNGKACYSPDCKGFVLSHEHGAPVPGGTVEPLSTFDGEDHFITLSIKKDEKTQDWSLYRHDGNAVLIGWWPKSLFNNTFDMATRVIWQGGVLYPKNETSPPMGSSHAACEGEHKAAYISHIKVFDQYGKTMEPYKVQGVADKKDCFTIDEFKYSREHRNHFYYGGPAGCIN
ncbi:NEP-interacting protein (DUF239) [Rhynchospora pubera]|uniref:NEP-interacting protein (DUF239) n=1 Tax=Rhynchospora pubera TaxID=906938 RepID=A0AAV8CUP9_9POAL|nr:NEP-interacting protein (DUF239) [Rhynchospora pubera]